MEPQPMGCPIQNIVHDTETNVESINQLESQGFWLASNHPSNAL